MVEREAHVPLGGAVKDPFRSAADDLVIVAFIITASILLVVGIMGLLGIL